MKVTMNIRTDAKVKNEAMELFNLLGLDLSTAVNIFLRQAIIKQGMPFDISIGEPNEESLEVLNEVKALKRSPDITTYHNAEQLMGTIFNEI